MNTTLIDDGGAAFPSLYPRSDEDGKQGMSMRDYFAGQAIAGFCAKEDRDWSSASRAEAAYRLADAMLEARKERL
jgi:hypothetical protein